MYDRRSCRTTETATAVSASSPTETRCRLPKVALALQPLLALAHPLGLGALQFVAPLDQLGLCTRETAFLAQSLRRAAYRLVRLLSAAVTRTGSMCGSRMGRRFVGRTLSHSPLGSHQSVRTGRIRRALVPRTPSLGLSPLLVLVETMTLACRRETRERPTSIHPRVRLGWGSSAYRRHHSRQALRLGITGSSPSGGGSDDHQVVTVRTTAR